MRIELLTRGLTDKSGDILDQRFLNAATLVGTGESRGSPRLDCLRRYRVDQVPLRGEQIISGLNDNARQPDRRRGDVVVPECPQLSRGKLYTGKHLIRRGEDPL
jgi:hypothetical protein